VFVGSVIVWAVLSRFKVVSPIWAIAAMIASTDPQVDVARRMIRSRLINVCAGAGVGLVFLLVGGSTPWKLPFALAATVLISSYLLRITTMWRQAPITAALIIATGLAQDSTAAGFQAALLKVAQVLFGCLVGIAVSWLISRVWPLPETSEPSAENETKHELSARAR
jgi:uncharacterized membrane protein YccC